jgi:acetate kinase
MRRIFASQKFFGYFDTAFHQTISKDIYTYAIDPKIAKKYNIRKYGFHGIAVESALDKIEKLYKSEKVKLPKKIIFAHLGGGSSITAVKNKKSFATTMELTPISGLMMTTRVGDVDSDLDKILAKKMNKSIYEISDMLNYESGFLGLTGTKDIKKIFDE